MMHLNIESEIDPLEAVVLHSPGAEIEAMTPASAAGLLYNDIIPLEVVRTHHRQFAEVLGRFCDVHELTDLAVHALENDTLREAACSVLAGQQKERLLSELLSLNAQDLVRTIVEGIPLKRDSLHRYLSEDRYERPPLPNLYFMRDAAAVVRNGFVTGAMAYPVRAPESMLLAIALKGSAAEGSPHLFDGTAEASRGCSLEGGDLLVIDRNLLVVGVSERTNAAAIDRLVSRIVDSDEPDPDTSMTVIAVPLPRERYAIHLDMLFTMIDHNCALVHGPSMLGETALPAVEMRCRPGGERSFHRHRSLLRCLSALGKPVETVVCGGDLPIAQEREQWLSGTNAFAISPGVIVVYDCNTATLDELRRAGFHIECAEDVSRGQDQSAHAKRNSSRVKPGGRRRAITIPGAELARGGGGPRCMTLPLRRRSPDVR